MRRVSACVRACVYVYFVCAGPVISQARPIQRNIGRGWCCCLARCVDIENGTVSLWVARAVYSVVNEDRTVRCDAVAEVLSVNGAERQLCVNDWLFAVHGGVPLMQCILAVGLRNRDARGGRVILAVKRFCGQRNYAFDKLFNM